MKSDLRDPLSYPTLFTSVERVFFYAPHQGSTPVTEMMQAMKSAGVQRVVFLSSKWVQDWPEELFARMHAPLEEAVKTAGLSYTFLRPGNFSSNVFMHWMGEVRATGAVSLVRPNAQSAPIAPEDIAAVGVTALMTDELLNASPPLTGPRSMSQQEQIDVRNEARESAGKVPIRAQLKSAEDWKTAAIQHMPAVVADALLRMWENTDGKPERVQNTERLTGKPATTFEAWVEKNNKQLNE